MLLSIITPTHDTKRLQRLADSIKKQTYTDYEWVVVPNNGASLSGIDLGDKARIVEYTGENSNIGAIKNFAFKQGKGTLLIEVDHDDEILPNCLQELADAHKGKQCDFYYSNFIHNIEGEEEKNKPWSEKYGWEYKKIIFDGKVHYEVIAFPPIPASVCKIWYAPNHIRAWATSFYNAIDGHNPDLEVCDDHDLIARTYVMGTMHHINKCLYVQNMHDSNVSTGDKNMLIQETCWKLYRQYINDIVDKWCDTNGLVKVDLHSGVKSPNNYRSLDLTDSSVLSKLTGRWPFEDGEIGLFRAHDVLMRFSDPVHAMSEMYRCLAPMGWVLSSTPSTDGRGAFQDPTHKSYWNSNSFWYYSQEQLGKYIGSPTKFQVISAYNYTPTDWHRDNNIVYTTGDLYKFDGRTPGEVYFPKI